jgi:hypothetical protein
MLDILTLEDETTTLSENIRHQSPSDNGTISQKDGDLINIHVCTYVKFWYNQYIFFFVEAIMPLFQ